ncbi:M3 family metallopeptidase [Nitrosophilus alvini]|uniref:M3 family metallopeptidase n=1 Tax=Nitrosophilus alvini TaxID=2714855 RepID=UPI001909CB5D|nr:M3 family metallopeptidase [Nitrosophilus alvini]
MTNDFAEFTVNEENLPQQKEKVLEKIEENRKAVEKLLENPDKNYSNFIKPYQLMHEELDFLFSPISHLNYVKNSETTEKIYEEILPVLTEYYAKLGQDERVYKAFKEIKEKEPSLSEEQKKVLEDSIKDFELSGVGLEKSKQERIKEISITLSTLTNSFAQNLLKATDAYEMIVENEEDVKELPKSDIEAAKIQKEGKSVYRFTLKQPSYVAYMTYGSNRTLREKLYKAYVTRAPENDELITQILSLRDEKAKLLGFENYARLSLQRKMAKTPEEVISFLRELSKKSRPQAQKELEELKEFAKKEGFKEELQPFDIAYYSEKLKKHKFSLNDEDYMPYLEKKSVVEGLFEFLKKLFGLEFEKVKVPVWDESVEVFHLYRKGSVVGRLYMDLEAREGKRGGAWMDEWVTYHEDEKGRIIPPVAFIVANFSKPTADMPALLRPNDVETLFHEMGHALHHLLSRVKEPFVSGISGVEWDAVEFPSQFLENFAYEKKILKSFARHYKSGEPMPDFMVEKLKESKNFHSALAMLRQIEFGLFDMLIHMGKYDADGVQRILEEVREEVSVIRTPEYNRFQWGFGHIFAGGYAAGYYSYKWAEVLSADAFFMFVDNGIFNEDISESFVAEVLSRGGSREAMESFKAFAKREPDIEAILKLSGIEVL